MTIDTLEFAPWSMVKYGIFRSNLWSEFRSTILTMENLNFGRGHGQNFDHMTMTPGHRLSGQKIVVALPPPNYSIVNYKLCDIIVLKVEISLSLFIQYNSIELVTIDCIMFDSYSFKS